jgi:hypothetical protein
MFADKIVPQLATRDKSRWLGRKSSMNSIECRMSSLSVQSRRTIIDHDGSFGNNAEILPDQVSLATSSASATTAQQTATWSTVAVSFLSRFNIGGKNAVDRIGSQVSLHITKQRDFPQRAQGRNECPASQVLV